jgi:dihydrolipoamide dehydrogenase
VEIIQGSGQITGKEKVEVNGQVISCRNIILAAGGTWRKPDFEGADLEEVINSDELLKEDRIPKKALLYGSSPWLIEIAQFLRRFGCEAILATEDKSILSHESKTIHARLKRALKDEGVEVLTGVHVSSVKKENDGLHVDLDSSKGIQSVVVDRLVTVKRRAAIHGLGLETVELDESREYFEVDRKMQTEVKGIYAIGDLTAPPTMHYSHRASGQGIVAAENAMGENANYKQKTVPRVLFTAPQVSCVGLTAKEAKNLGYDVVVGSAPYSVNPFGMILSEETGIVEVVAEKRYGELLGAHFIGTSASEMVGQAVVAIHMEATLEDLIGMSFPHPTLSESLVEAAREALGRPIYLP